MGLAQKQIHDGQETLSWTFNCFRTFYAGPPWGWLRSFHGRCQYAIFGQIMPGAQLIHIRTYLASHPSTKGSRSKTCNTFCLCGCRNLAFCDPLKVDTGMSSARFYFVHKFWPRHIRISKFIPKESVHNLAITIHKTAVKYIWNLSLVPAWRQPGLVCS